MSRFYGLQWYEIDQMPQTLFRDYLRSIDILQAEEELRNITATTYPKMSSGVRDKVFNGLKDRATERLYVKEKKILKSEDLARMLGQWQTKK